MQHLDRQQRVFVDRVAVIEIAQHQQVNRLELRDRVGQQVQGMHGAKRLCGVWQA